MSLRSLRYRANESNNIWPGFVDVLATLLIVIIFVLMVFTVSQIYLSDAISGRDKALQNLRSQINELSKILIIEAKDKQKALSSLELTVKDLKDQQIYSQNLEKNIAEKKSEIFIQDQNIIALSQEIKNLLIELRIVANALETYEEIEVSSIDTKGLGEKINKALASRIDQLNVLNKNLDKSNQALAKAENNLKSKIQDLDKLNNNLMAINESLGLGDADLIDQLNAIKNKNMLLENSKLELQIANENILKVNNQLILKDEILQEQILEYQKITNDLLLINDGLGLEDASLLEQLEAIRSKNSKLADLNLNLIKKDNTIFSLREKILELNNILTLSDERQNNQNNTINELKTNLNSLKSDKLISDKNNRSTMEEITNRSNETLKQVDYLSNEIEILKNEINLLNSALESSEQQVLSKELKIEVLGERLNKALTSKVFELQKYRSEFFGKLKTILGDRDDIKIVGDRFIFESELLFDSGSADLTRGWNG